VRADQPFFGIFAALAASSPSHVCVTSLYEGLFADVYTAAGVESEPDLAFFLEQIARRPGRVLELGCGTGQATVRLARTGHPIDAVDRSGAMLRHLEQRLRSAGVEGRVSVGQADLLQTHWERKYHVIVVSAVMFPTFLADGGQAWLASLAAALTPDGVLCFDAEPPMQGHREPHVLARSMPHPDGPLNITQGFLATEDPPGHVFNIYIEQRRPDGSVRRELSAERILAFGPHVEAELVRAGFLLVDSRAWGGDGTTAPSIGQAWTASSSIGC
jgi:SAM-dependent methyltransferase